MADQSAGSASQSPVAPTTSVIHSVDCPLHESPLLNRCNAMTAENVQCQRLSALSARAQSDLLPTCKQHNNQEIQAGHCQATAECGRRCGALSEHNAPFHLCTRHADGTETLPCFILGLPAELRHEIWRYLLPETIPALPTGHPRRNQSFQRNDFSILWVNRQISNEALAVMYNEVPFEVDIERDSISLCGRSSYAGDPKKESQSRGRSLFDLRISRACFVSIPRSICNFRFTIQVDVALAPPQGIHLGKAWDRQAITPNDYHVFQTRIKLKKLIDAIRRENPTHADGKGTNKVIQSLELGIRFICDNTRHLDEAFAMVVLTVEPFKTLKNIRKSRLHLTSIKYRHNTDLSRLNADFQAYKSEWESAMSQPGGPASEAYMGPSQSLIDQSKKELRRIEEFVSFLRTLNLTSFGECYRASKIKEDLYQVSHFGEGEQTSEDGEDYPSSRHVYCQFRNIARVVHLARVASGQWDLENLAKIRNVLLKRWTLYRRKHRQETKRVADSLLTLFEGFEPTETFLRYENLLTLPVGELETECDHEWSELRVGSFYTRRLSTVPEGVTYTEDREYRYSFKSGEFTGAVLKTPHFVRYASS